MSNTSRVDTTFDPNNLQPAGDAGGAHRVFVSERPWPVTILCRDANTEPKVDPVLPSHLRHQWLGKSEAPDVLNKFITDIKQDGRCQGNITIQSDAESVYIHGFLQQRCRYLGINTTCSPHSTRARAQRFVWKNFS